MQTDIDFTKLFRDAVKDDNAYYEALSIARMNTQGKLWVIGSYVYRTLAEHLYGMSVPAKDIDFVAERMQEKCVVPAGWTQERSSYGTPKLICGERVLDVFSLDMVVQPIRWQGKRTIESYLAGATLTIQSIAYDVCGRRIIGDIGMKALRDRTVAYNMTEVSAAYFAKKGYTQKSYLLEKSAGLGFRIILPDPEL